VRRKEGKGGLPDTVYHAKKVYGKEERESAGKMELPGSVQKNANLLLLQMHA